MNFSNEEFVTLTLFTCSREIKKWAFFSRWMRRWKNNWFRRFIREYIWNGCSMMFLALFLAFWAKIHDIWKSIVKTIHFSPSLTQLLAPLKEQTKLILPKNSSLRPNKIPLIVFTEHEHRFPPLYNNCSFFSVRKTSNLQFLLLLLLILLHGINNFFFSLIFQCVMCVDEIFRLFFEERRDFFKHSTNTTKYNRHCRHWNYWYSCLIFLWWKGVPSDLLLFNATDEKIWNAVTLFFNSVSMSECYWCVMNGFLLV